MAPGADGGGPVQPVLREVACGRLGTASGDGTASGIMVFYFWFRVMA